MKRRNLAQILIAVGLMAVGVALICIFLFGWSPKLFAGWWTLLIMAAAVASMISQGLRFWNSLLLGGAILLFAHCQEFVLVNGRQFWGSVGALALILLGISLIINLLRPRREERGYVQTSDFGGGKKRPEDTPFSGEEKPSRFALFSSEVCRSDCKSLRGGNFTAIFGGVVADLSQTDINRPVSIDVYTLFGGIDIYAPANVRVECKGTSIFGGCDAKAVTARPYDAARPVFTVNYFNVFGGINVK